MEEARALCAHARRSLGERGADEHRAGRRGGRDRDDGARERAERAGRSGDRDGRAARGDRDERAERDEQHRSSDRAEPPGEGRERERSGRGDEEGDLSHGHLRSEALRMRVRDVLRSRGLRGRLARRRSPGGALSNCDFAVR